MFEFILLSLARSSMMTLADDNSEWSIANMPYRKISGNSHMHIDHNSHGVIGDTWLNYGKVTGFNVLTIQDVEYELKSFDAFTIPKGTMHGVVGNGFREYKAIDSVTGLGVGFECDVGKYRITLDPSAGSICQNCPSGTYQDEETSCMSGMCPCKSCGLGTYQDQEGQTQCEPIKLLYMSAPDYLSPCDDLPCSTDPSCPQCTSEHANARCVFIDNVPVCMVQLRQGLSLTTYPDTDCFYSETTVTLGKTYVYCNDPAYLECHDPVCDQNQECQVIITELSLSATPQCVQRASEFSTCSEKTILINDQVKNTKACGALDPSKLSCGNQGTMQLPDIYGDYYVCAQAAIFEPIEPNENSFEDDMDGQGSADIIGDDACVEDPSLCKMDKKAVLPWWSFTLGFVGIPLLISGLAGCNFKQKENA